MTPTKAPKKTAAERSASRHVGDGKLPNLYYVSISTGYLTNKANAADPETANCYDGANESYPDLPERSETFGPFKTFEEAKGKADELGAECSDPSDNFDDYHSVTIEDRLSGQVYDGTWIETWKAHPRFPSVKHEWKWSDDTKYTRDEMKRCGVEFK